MAGNQTQSAERPTRIQPLHPVSNVESTAFETLAEASMALLTNQEFCDVTFCVGPSNQEIKCHKLFLMSRSDVFKTMFSARWDSSRTIHLPEIEPEAFQLFLEFIYGDKFTSSVHTASKLLELGHKYNVNVLVKKCEALISRNLTLENSILIFKLARHYSLGGLMRKAGNLMASSFVQLANHGTFREIDEETLIYLLRRDDLPILEIDLFTIVVRWARNSMGINGSFSQVLKNIIPLLRFPLMTAQEFATNVVPLQLLAQEDVLDLFLYFNSQGTVRENAARSMKFSCKLRKGQKLTKLELYEVNDETNQLNFLRRIESTGALESYHHEDILEITWNSETSIDSVHPKIKLTSLMLQGMNYDSLRSMWPLEYAPHSNSMIEVRIRANYFQPSTSSNHRNLSDPADWIFLSNPYMLSKGKETEVVVEPQIELKPNVKYHIVVKFQCVHLINTCLSKRKWDVMTGTILRTTLVDPAFRGVLKVNVVETPNSSYVRNLHVVRALKLASY